MRFAIAVVGLVFLLQPAFSQDKPPAPAEVDRQLVDVLKTIHNRGGEIFNAGDPDTCLALFQGSLLTARAVLVHRPAEQKYIDDQLAAVQRMPAVSDQAFALHTTIATLRERLKTAPKPVAQPELILPQPREMPSTKLEEPRPLPKTGVNGRVTWQSNPLAGVEIAFVEREAKESRTFRVVAGPDGRYLIDNVPAGKYTVLLTAPKDPKIVLPERYTAVGSSPLIVDIKGDGETLDLMLK